MYYDPLMVNGNVLNGFARSRHIYPFAESVFGITSNKAVAGYIRSAEAADVTRVSSELALPYVIRNAYSTAQVQFTSFGTISIEMFGSASNVFGFDSSAVGVANRYFDAQSELAFGTEAWVSVNAAMAASSVTDIASISARMSIETWGYGDAGTTISNEGDGSTFVESPYSNVNQVNGGLMNGYSRSYRQFLFAESTFSINTDDASFGVSIWGYTDDVEFTVWTEGTSVRFLLPTVSNSVAFSTSEESLHTHYMRTDSRCGFEPRLSQPDILISAGFMQDGVAFTTSGQPLEFVYFSIVGFESVDSSPNRVQRFTAKSSLDISVEDTASPNVYRRVRSTIGLGLSTYAETRVNGVHEAVVSAAFDFFASSEDALVRSNSLGDADLRFLSTLDSAKANVRHAFRAKSTFDFEAQGSIFVNLMVNAKAEFRVHASGVTGRRTRLFKGITSFGVDSRQTIGYVRRKARAASNVNIAAMAAAVRSAQFATDSVLCIKQTAAPRRWVSDEVNVLIQVMSTRATGLSNLTIPASNNRMFIVDSREFVFVVPEENRSFTV